MRRPTVFLLLAALGPTLVLARSTEKPIADAKTSLHRVDDVAQKPREFVGKEIDVFGVVGQVYPEKGGLLLIDSEEFEKCHTNVSCAVGRLIPVVLDGELPAVEKSIVVTGSLKENAQGRFVFEADSYREGTP